MSVTEKGVHSPPEGGHTTWQVPANKSIGRKGQQNTYVRNTFKQIIKIYIIDKYNANTNSYFSKLIKKNIKSH